MMESQPNETISLKNIVENVVHHQTMPINNNSERTFDLNSTQPGQKQLAPTSCILIKDIIYYKYEQEDQNTTSTNTQQSVTNTGYMSSSPSPLPNIHQQQQQQQQHQQQQLQDQQQAKTTTNNNNNNKHLNNEIMSPSSNSSSSPSSLSNNNNNASKPNAYNQICQLNESNSSQQFSECNFSGGANVVNNSSGANVGNSSVAGKLAQSKKPQKKKTSHLTSELDEERTSQLVSEILKNIKEKTKELESLNQNLKGTTSSALSTSSSSSSSSSSSCLSNPPNPNIKLAFNLVHTPAEIDLNKSEDSYFNEEASLTDLTDHQHHHHLNHDHLFSNHAHSFKATPTKKTSSKSTKTASHSPKSHQQTSKSTRQLIEIPIGWTRTLTNDSQVVYTSPSGFRLKSYQEVRAYLLSENTCKCGLQCPLNMYEVFNFSSAYQSKQAKSSAAAGLVGCACKNYVNSYSSMVEKIEQEKKSGGKKGGGKNRAAKILDDVNENLEKIGKSKRSNNQDASSNGSTRELKTPKSKKRNCINQVYLNSDLINNTSQQFIQDYSGHEQNFVKPNETESAGSMFVSNYEETKRESLENVDNCNSFPFMLNQEREKFETNDLLIRSFNFDVNKMPTLNNLAANILAQEKANPVDLLNSSTSEASNIHCENTSSQDYRELCRLVNGTDGI